MMARSSAFSAFPFQTRWSPLSGGLHALTTFLLDLNDIVKHGGFELPDKNFTSVKLPNAAAFHE